MEGGGGDAETLKATDDGNQFSVVAPSRAKACVNNEHITESVFEIVTSNAQILETVVVKSQVVLGDGSMTGLTFVENDFHESEIVNEDTVSETPGFVGTCSNGVDALEENAETNGIMGSSITQDGALKENTADDPEDAVQSPDFAENPGNGTFEEDSIVDLGSETNALDKETVDGDRGFVDSTVGESSSFENHAIDEPRTAVEDSMGDTHAFIEDTANVTHALEDSTGEETCNFVDADSVGDDVHLYVENASNESGTFADDVCVNERVYEEDLINSKDRVSVGDTLEESKASVGNEDIRTHSVVHYFKSFVEARKEKRPLIEAVDEGKPRAAGKERTFELDYRRSVSGRRSYRADVGGPPLPSRVVTERLQPAKEPRVSRLEPERAAGKEDGPRGRKREREESPVSAQAAKRKKLFPFSLFSYLSFLSPLTLLSLFKGNRQDIVIEESLLTDESEESD